MAQLTSAAQFTQDMEAAGYEVNSDYHGRWYYRGPAVVIAREAYQDVIRATTVRVHYDQMGKSQIIVYLAE